MPASRTHAPATGIGSTSMTKLGQVVFAIGVAMVGIAIGKVGGWPALLFIGGIVVAGWALITQ